MIHDLFEKGLGWTAFEDKSDETVDGTMASIILRPASKPAPFPFDRTKTASVIKDHCDDPISRSNCSKGIREVMIGTEVSPVGHERWTAAC